MTYYAQYNNSFRPIRYRIEAIDQIICAQHKETRIVWKFNLTSHQNRETYRVTKYIIILNLMIIIFFIIHCSWCFLFQKSYCSTLTILSDMSFKFRFSPSYNDLAYILNSLYKTNLIYLLLWFIIKISQILSTKV